MMSQVVVVEPFVTFVAEVRSAEESGIGIATVVMMSSLMRRMILSAGTGPA